MKLKAYYEATPANFRKWGDTILVTGTLLLSSVLISDHDWLIAVGLIFTVIGKVITNFFTDAK